MKTETESVLSKEALRRKFEQGTEARNLVVRELGSRLEQALSTMDSQPAIKVRSKKFPSYYKKYLRLLKLGNSSPLITDLMGIRIICPFIEDLEKVVNLLRNHFDVVEVERKGHYSFKEFGYESTHLLIKIPDDIAAQGLGEIGSDVAEIQIRTILQDAWAEVEHELFYKAEFNPFDIPMKRKLAAVNASLSLADIVFQEIRDYQKRLNGQIERRRETFYRKIEESTDALLFSEMDLPQKNSKRAALIVDRDNGSIDDLLLDALKAHNENQFDDAITVYSHILELKPDKTICSLIYKHRGMAYFAQSKYQEAIDDFGNALALDARSYRVAYYRGVVHSVLKKYPEAIDDFSLSLGINPYQAFCLFRRGQAYYHIGDYPKALSDCEESLSIEPENETAQKFRTLVQSKLKM